MPVSYSPEKDLENYSGFMYEFLLKKSFDETLSMGNIGASSFRNIINAGLVGLSEKYAPFIDRSIEWMQYGIDSKEGGRSFLFEHAKFSETIALAKWYKEGFNDLALWQQVTVYHQRMVVECTNIYPPIDMRTAQLDDLGLRCLQAEEYEKYIDAYRHYTGKNHIPSLGRITKSERGLAYAYCLHYTAGHFSADDLRYRAMLLFDKNMEAEWIGRGQSVRALLWLKFLYWNEDKQLSPLEVWLKAYDHMRNVELPEFFEEKYMYLLSDALGDIEPE